jgi:hypothetical protein
MYIRGSASAHQRRYEQSTSELIEFFQIKAAFALVV